MVVSKARILLHVVILRCCCVLIARSSRSSCVCATICSTSGSVIAVEVACEQALCLGKNSEERPVHRLQLKLRIPRPQYDIGLWS